MFHFIIKSAFDKYLLTLWLSPSSAHVAAAVLQAKDNIETHLSHSFSLYVSHNT